MNNWFKLILRWSLGLAFFISGALKLVPAEYLENDILKSGLGNEWTVPFQARFIISTEFIIGSLLMIGIFLRTTLKFSLLSLIIYSCYLVYLIFIQGNEGNCGCMGHRLVLTPAEGIFKNLIMILVSVFLMRKIADREWKRFHRIILAFVLILGLGLPYVLYKVDLPDYIEVNGSEMKKLKLDLLYPADGSEQPEFEVRRGKVVLVFASLGCEHCRIAANKLEIIKREHPELPVYFILNGKMELLPDFISESDMREIPYYICNDGDLLVELIGVKYPRILLLEDSHIRQEIDYRALNSANLTKWYNQ